MNSRLHTSAEEPQPIQASYEAPRVEQVLSAEELQREVLYAGFLPTDI